MVLAVVGIGITAGVYGAVALIVKADDVGVALARNAPDRSLGRAVARVGRGLVRGMPVLPAVLALVGTAAMIWVGGGIVVHGLEDTASAGSATPIHAAAEAVGHALPALPGAVAWLVSAAGSGLVGLALGLALIPLVRHVFGPAGALVFRAPRERAGRGSYARSGWANLVRRSGGLTM